MRAIPKRRVRREVHGNFAGTHSSTRATKRANGANRPGATLANRTKTEQDLERKINKNLFVFL
jgi:hypothetical protein